MAYSSSISAFMASAFNSIMKSMVFHFPCLNVSIFHSASAAFVLSLNVILISLMNSFQSWVPSSSSSSSSFFCTYMPTIPLLRQARIAVILLLISITLLLLRNNHIPLYQFLNFVWSLLNHPRSSTMFFSITTYIFSLNAAGAGVTDISVSVCSYSSEASSAICKDPSCFNNISISFILLELIFGSSL